MIIEHHFPMAIVEGMGHYVSNPGSIITMGGETFGPILFSQDGQ